MCKKKIGTNFKEELFILKCIFMPDRSILLQIFSHLLRKRKWIIRFNPFVNISHPSLFTPIKIISSAIVPIHHSAAISNKTTFIVRDFLPMSNQYPCICIFQISHWKNKIFLIFFCVLFLNCVSLSSNNQTLEAVKRFAIIALLIVHQLFSDFNTWEINKSIHFRNILSIKQYLKDRKINFLMRNLKYTGS